MRRVRIARRNNAFAIGPGMMLADNLRRFAAIRRNAQQPAGGQLGMRGIIAPILRLLQRMMLQRRIGGGEQADIVPIHCNLQRIGIGRIAILPVERQHQAQLQPGPVAPLGAALHQRCRQQPALRQSQRGGYNDGNSAAAGGNDYVGSLGHIWGGWRDCAAVPDFPDALNRFQRGGQFTPWVDGNDDNSNMNTNGCFKYHGSWRLADILDGTSNTIAVFEDMHWQLGPASSANPKNRNSCDDSAWMSPLGAIGNLRNPMNQNNKQWWQGQNDRRCHGWSSNHPGGALATRADGTVQFYAETIDHITRYALATRAGGEAVNSP